MQTRHDDDFEVDREVAERTYGEQCRAALDEGVADGAIDAATAARMHAAFMRSPLLQGLIDRDVEMVLSMLRGQVH